MDDFSAHFEISTPNFHIRKAGYIRSMNEPRVINTLHRTLIIIIHHHKPLLLDNITPRAPSIRSLLNRSNMAARRPRTPTRRQLVTAAPRGTSNRTNSQPRIRHANFVPRPIQENNRGGPGPAAAANAEQQPAPQETHDSPAFLEQLRTWAAATITKELAQLEAEFTRLQSQPKPEPCPEFTRNPQSNRYRDVLCCETNRVKLNNGKYIHANWIEATNGERRFICTQGPLAQTTEDFWNLVIQEKVEAVVMLCNTVELNRPKCHQYWPEKEGEEITINADTTVKFATLEKLDNYLYKTRLTINSTNNPPMLVRHFHWRDWPDRGVPINHLASLRLLFYLQAYKRIAVHCSAGIGRTGTIVAIYMAQSRMRAGQALDLYDLVTELRRQRAGSVQSFDQYLYIYSVLLRFAKNKQERGHIQLDNDATERLIQAIAKRIYPHITARADGNK